MLIGLQERQQVGVLSPKKILPQKITRAEQSGQCSQRFLFFQEIEGASGAATFEKLIEKSIEVVERLGGVGGPC